MPFSRKLHFISSQTFDVHEGKIQCRKNKRVVPYLKPFEKEDLPKALTLEDGDVIFVIPQKFLNDCDQKILLTKRI